MKIEITERDAANISRLMAMSEWTSVQKVLEEARQSLVLDLTEPLICDKLGSMAWLSGMIAEVAVIEDRLAQLQQEHLERVKAADHKADSR